MSVKENGVVEELAVVDKPILEGGSRGFENRRHAEGRHPTDGLVVGVVESEGASLEGASLNFAGKGVRVFGFFKGKNPKTIVEVGGGPRPQTNSTNNL